MLELKQTAYYVIDIYSYKKVKWYLEDVLMFKNMYFKLVRD